MKVQWPETDSVVGVGFKTYPSFRFLVQFLSTSLVRSSHLKLYLKCLTHTHTHTSLLCTLTLHSCKLSAYCVCVCACVPACVRARACVCVCLISSMNKQYCDSEQSELRLNGCHFNSESLVFIEVFHRTEYDAKLNTEENKQPLPLIRTSYY